MLKKLIKLLPVMLLASLLAASASVAAAAPPVQTDEPAGLLDVAAEDGRFSTLIAGLEEAGLDETLQGEGPFTIFAPTNEAFAQLPSGAIEDLFADTPALENTLLYHVVEGRVSAADVSQTETLETLTGKLLTVSVDGETVMINNAQVINADVEAANGLIHVIDTVLTPPQESPAQTEEGAMEEGAMMEESATMEEGAMEEGAMTEEEAMAAPMVETCAENYVVQADDWLSKIAERFLGDVLAYPTLAEATNAAAAQSDAYIVIDNPDVIEPGQTICIPPTETEMSEDDTMSAPAEETAGDESIEMEKSESAGSESGE